MKKLIVFTIFFCSCIFSCKYGVTMNIDNTTNDLITNIKVTNGFNEVHIDTLKGKTTKELFLDFKSNNTKADGAFEISFKRNLKRESQKFDYYSNGIPSVESYEIVIKNDTVIVR